VTVDSDTWVELSKLTSSGLTHESALLGESKTPVSVQLGSLPYLSDKDTCTGETVGSSQGIERDLRGVSLISLGDGVGKGSSFMNCCVLTLRRRPFPVFLALLTCGFLGTVTQSLLSRRQLVHGFPSAFQSQRTFRLLQY
jgi:hypothetical protein